MKKSPHRFLLFMCSCCSCSFSPCRRLHVLEPGSNWIELVCGRVPIRLASRSPHLQSFSRSSRDLSEGSLQLQAAVCMATFTENSTAQRPQASKWTHTAHRFCTSTRQFLLGAHYVPLPLCYCTLCSSPYFLSLSCPRLILSFQSIIACSCSQNVI